MIAFIVLCSHHHCQFQDTFTPPKTLLAVMPTFPSSPQLLATINPFSLSMDFPILAILYTVHGIIQYVPNVSGIFHLAYFPGPSML